MNCVLFFSILLQYCIHPVQVNTDITGTWEVVSASVSDQIQLEEEAAKQFEPFMDAFKGSMLEFRKNGSSSFRTRVPQFNYKDYFWTYEESTSEIRISEKRNSAPVLGIVVASANDSTLFYLMETPFILTVRKVKR